MPPTESASVRALSISATGKEIDAGGADVALEFLSEFVVMDFADESAVGAQRGEAGNGIGRRTAGNLAFGNEVGIDFAGVGRFDQLCRGGGHARDRG